MTQSTAQPPTGSAFRRSLAFLRPHMRPLVIGLVAAMAVGLFYAASLSSVVPLLKVMIADHESFRDWLNRSEAERRLGVSFPADAPENPDGLTVQSVHRDQTSDNASVLRGFDVITEVNGLALSSYQAIEAIAKLDEATTIDVVIRRGRESLPLTLKLHATRPWHRVLNEVAERLPIGRAPADRTRMLAIVMVALVIVSILGAVSRFYNEGLVNLAVQRSMHDLRASLADRVLRLPVDWHSQHPHGDTLGRFATDISKVEVGMATLFGKTVREPIKAVGVLILTILIDWRMLVVALIGLPIGGMLLYTFGRMVKKAQKRASESWGRLLDHLGERLAGIRIVKSYNMQDAESRRFATEGSELMRAQTRIEWIDAATNPALEVLAVIAVSAFTLYGGARVFNGELSPQAFFTAVVCLGGVFDPVRKLGNVNNRLQAAEASAKRLFEYLDLPIEEPRATSATQSVLAPLRNSIEFRDIRFAYSSNLDTPVLDAINFRVTKGSIVALVGPNGSGKTTLVSLLMRFYEPTKGSILIDGVNIADVTLASLRGQIGLVTQDAVIFSDTVRTNISYGAGDQSHAVVEQAARLAHADDFIRELRVEGKDGRVTRGYDARVSTRTLSGGQKQRIALARAILRNPSILILDEATSQVDTESERKIQEALDDVTRDRTTFIIAHRFSTIARADMIAVLDNGKLVGLGRHDELIGTCPTYATLCHTQFAHVS